MNLGRTFSTLVAGLAVLGSVSISAAAEPGARATASPPVSIVAGNELERSCLAAVMPGPMMLGKGMLVGTVLKGCEVGAEIEIEVILHHPGRDKLHAFVTTFAITAGEQHGTFVQRLVEEVDLGYELVNVQILKVTRLTEI